MITAEETEPQEGRLGRSQILQAQPAEERKGDTPLGCSGRRAIRRKQRNKFVQAAPLWARQLRNSGEGRCILRRESPVATVVTQY
jgi:hypothetical protein